MKFEFAEEDDTQADHDYVNSLFRKINARKRMATRNRPATPYMAHPWHNVEIGQALPDVVNIVTEIPMGSRVKTELDVTTGLLKLDRILYSSIVYPANYGFVPQTLAGGREPLDVLVLCQLSVPPLCIMRVRPIGLMRMLDRGEPDDKIIAVCVTDPEYNIYYDVSELPPYRLLLIEQFFNDYKVLERKTLDSEHVGVEDAEGAKTGGHLRPRDVVRAFPALGAGRAKRTILDAHTAYLKHYELDSA
jgi:inorganic pyrophosphatase